MKGYGWLKKKNKQLYAVRHSAKTEKRALKTIQGVSRERKKENKVLRLMNKEQRHGNVRELGNDSDENGIHSA